MQNKNPQLKGQDHLIEQNLLVFKISRISSPYPAVLSASLFISQVA